MGSRPRGILQEQSRQSNGAVTAEMTAATGKQGQEHHL